MAISAVVDARKRGRTEGRPAADFRKKPEWSLARDRGLLAGLEQVPWHALSHAYGPAVDVPGRIVDLLSPSEAVRQDAIGELHGNIWHQGTIYEASAPAVPFLVELAASPVTPDRAGVLFLLSSLATGDTERPEQRTAVRDAAIAGLPIYLALLASEPWKVRVASAHLLGAYPQREAEIAPALRRALEAEANLTARAGFLLSFGHLGASGATSAILERSLRSSDDAGERLASALALSRLPDPPLAREAAHLLATALVDVEQTQKLLAGLPWDVWGEEDLGEALRQLGAEGADVATPILLDGLAGAGAVDASYIIEALLGIAFGEERLDALVPGALRDHQRQILRAIVASDGAWKSPGIWATELQWHGLPTDRRALEALAAGSPE